MRVTKSFTVEQTGIGKPDYSREVSSGLERAGLYLKYNQRLKLFGRSFNIGDVDYPLLPVTPLASGANTHMRDLETNLLLPVTIPAGYTLSMLTIGSTGNQDFMVYSYLDNALVTSVLIAMGSGGTDYVNKMIGFSTSMIDPTGASAHTLDVKIYNRGGGDLYGGVTIDAILEKVGSPPWPTTKECECPYCGNRQRVPIDTSTITCSKCGKVYVVYNLSKYRSSI